ncbi:MAG TPA: hypothetical protein VG102_03255 [Candidatus Paceibacterota bacterium]|jgi:hypothetical protein|nr:hypothetical protein [Candidatus Paceibacterota bacterium]
MVPLIAGLILSNTVSNSTGGLTAQAGDVVHSGDSYSSVSVQTYANDEGGTSTVQIETDENGQVNKQTYTKTVPAGGNANVFVATSTGSAHVNIGSFIGVGTSTKRHALHVAPDVVSASTSASSSVTLQASNSHFSFNLRAFLQALFMYFHF